MIEYLKQRRNVLSIMVFLGTCWVYTLRINLSAAIVDMTTDHEIILPNGTHSMVKYFNWDSVQKGNILGSFFYGYISTQIISGYLASKYGGVLVFGISVGGTAIMTLLTPFCARISPTALVCLRIVEGILAGATFPSITVIWSKWSPPKDRTKLSGISYAGASLGTVLAFSGCGLIIDLLGWAYAFYIPGLLTLIWYALWIIYARSNPCDDPYIGQEELIYLKKCLPEADAKIRYPWAEISVSIPVWAVIIAFLFDSWGSYMLLTQLPMYLKDRFDFDATESGCLLTVPYILNAIMTIVSSIIADKLRKNMLTTTQVRKLLTCGAFVIEAGFFIIIAYADSAVVALVCLTASIGIGSSFTSPGFYTNPLDLAAQYAAVIYGIGNTFGTMSGIFCPNLAGYIVKNGTREEWKAMFLISAAIYVVGAIIYGIFASGVKQKWAYDENDLMKEEEAKMIKSKSEN